MESASHFSAILAIGGLSKRESYASMNSTYALARSAAVLPN